MRRAAGMDCPLVYLQMMTAEKTPIYLIALAEYGDQEQFYGVEEKLFFDWISNDDPTLPDGFIEAARAKAAGEAWTAEEIDRLEQHGPQLTSGSFENDKAQLVANYVSAEFIADTLAELIASLERRGAVIADEYHGLWY